MPVNPKHTALVLIEYQNDFTSAGSALSEVMTSEQLLAELGAAPVAAG